MRFVAGIAIAAVVGAFVVQDSSPHREDSNEIDAALVDLVGRAELIVLGSISDFRDGSAVDGPIRYECTVSEVLAGAPPPTGSFWFNSRGGGRLGSRGAKYWAGENVLLFLEGFSAGSPQADPVEHRVLEPFVYLAERDGITVNLTKQLEEIRAEVARR